MGRFGARAQDDGGAGVGVEGVDELAGGGEGVSVGGGVATGDDLGTNGFGALDDGALSGRSAGAG